MFAADLVISRHEFGIGDELFAVGLFRSRWGYQRNTPIVRSGIIAAMPSPGEPLLDESGETYHAYLIEMKLSPSESSGRFSLYQTAVSNSLQFVVYRGGRFSHRVIHSLLRPATANLTASLPSFTLS